MSNSKFDRILTTRTDTILVSDRGVMDQFAFAVAKALEAVEEAVTYAGAVSDGDITVALIRLEQLQAAVDRGHAIVRERLNNKPIGEFEDDHFEMDDFPEMSSAVDLFSPILEFDEPPTQDLLTVPQAAERLGLPKDELILMMNAGRIKAVASNGQIMLHTDDVDALKRRTNLAVTRQASKTSIALTRQESQSAIEVEKSGMNELAPSSSPEDIEDFDDILDRLFDDVGIE